MPPAPSSRSNVYFGPNGRGNPGVNTGPGFYTRASASEKPPTPRVGEGKLRWPEPIAGGRGTLRGPRGRSPCLHPVLFFQPLALVVVQRPLAQPDGLGRDLD